MSVNYFCLKQHEFWWILIDSYLLHFWLDWLQILDTHLMKNVFKNIKLFLGLYIWIFVHEFCVLLVFWSFVMLTIVFSCVKVLLFNFLSFTFALIVKQGIARHLITRNSCYFQIKPERAKFLFQKCLERVLHNIYKISKKGNIIIVWNWKHCGK